MKKLYIIKDKEFYKNVLSIMLPVAAQQAISMGVNMLDTMMLGSFGEVQLSASSLANSFYMIFSTFCFGIVGGCSILMAQYWGAGEKGKTKEALNLAIRLSAIVAVLFAVITWCFPEAIMKMYSDDQQVIEAGVRYLKITTFVYLLHGTSLVTSQLLRAVKQAKLGLYVSILSFFINIGANWIFIFGHFGAPRMEIAGAALGTLIARAAEFVATFVFLLCIDKKLEFRPKDFIKNPSREVVSKYGMVGVSVLISDGILAFGNNALSMVIGRLGTVAVAANSVCQVVDRMFTVVITGISNAAGVIVGNTIGRGDKETAYLQGQTFYILSIIIGLVSAGLLLLIGPLTVSFYDLEEVTVQVTMQMMRAYAVIIFFQCVQFVMTKGVLRGGGDTRFLMVADILFLWVVSIPLGIVTGIVFKCPAWVVVLCLRADYVIKAVWCLKRLISGKWIVKIS